MEKQIRKLSWYVFITMIIVALIFVFSFFNGTKVDNIILSGEASPVVIDLIGTKTGTSTAGVGFSITATGGQSASTTYPYMVGNETDLAIYTLYAKNASSTANIQLSFLGSNDIECDTASTTSSLNAITTGEIYWFDIGDNLNNKVHSTSLAVGTSTLVWSNPVAGTGKTLLLNDLNYNCIALQVSGSSTVLWTQLEAKKFR